jgi:crossover junction endodeoxyribonuclease RuvC
VKIIGIDPGLTGAVAVFDLNNKALAVHDMPTVELKSGSSKKRSLSEPMLASILKNVDAEHAFIEHVSARPGQGVTSMFNFGVTYGVIRGVLAALDIPFTAVAPVKWQRDLALKQGKDANRAKAAELFPAFANNFTRVKDDGRADAALLAWWGCTHTYIQKIFEKDV